MSYYYLEVTRGIEPGRKYLLNDGAVSIGRSSQNTVALTPSEKSVSGHHAIIYKSPERIMIQDLQSTNGVFVNEERVTEVDLNVGDELGLGKAGPRLKLIESDIELDTSVPQKPLMVSQDSTSIKTLEDQARPVRMTSDFTSKENQDTITRIKLEPPRSDSDPFGGPSMTMQFEKKLLEKRVDFNDMHQLMNNGKRLEKILDRGNIGATQTNMLRSVYKAHRSMRRQWLYIIAGVVIVSLSATSFFAIRAYQYKQIVEEAKSLKREMEKYETQIASVKANPDANTQELKKLINQLEKKQDKFSDLKTRIDDEDFGKFYSDPLERQISEVLMRYGENDYHIPSEMVERVRHHIEIYSGNLSRTVSRYVERRQKYFPMIERIFREKNLPIELAYVSMLESGFNPLALSHAGARGLWQFMPATGRRYGLTVTDQLDERTDPEKATYAAAEFFKDLIGIFGGRSSVMLCMAAYNAGEGRVMGALRKIEDPMRNRDFWYIYRMGYLAEETNEYIPRIMALMLISENPSVYPFADKAQGPAPLEQERDFVEVDFKVE